LPELSFQSEAPADFLSTGAFLFLYGDDRLVSVAFGIKYPSKSIKGVVVIIVRFDKDLPLSEIHPQFLVQSVSRVIVAIGFFG
jgi:hypothetical protein